ncbi:MAG: NAD(P)H-dependent oxidoreductase [Myxococcales bacterium]|nr:NAD(P)H-dependent oxidoreductase [Myxococcales bacterium]
MSLDVLALSGSLRAGSFNTALLRAAGELAPAGLTLTLHDYADVPLYSEDLERPAGVDRLVEALASADALLLAVPEYNHSVPGVLKNALDWASRPAFRSALRGLPTGVVSASKSFVGGARGQQHAKTILLGMGTPVFPWPELLVGQAHQKFDATGALTDDTTRTFLGQFMEGFATWAAAQPR